jgi:hypothetical protein
MPKSTMHMHMHINAVAHTQILICKGRWRGAP